MERRTSFGFIWLSDVEGELGELGDLGELGELAWCSSSLIYSTSCSFWVFLTGLPIEKKIYNNKNNNINKRKKKSKIGKK